MNPFIELIITIINIYIWVIIAMVVMSWLVGFNVVNMQNDFVRQIRYALFRLTEPALAPIRRFLPDLGGLDLSPMVLLIALFFMQKLIVYYAPMLF